MREKEREARERERMLSASHHYSSQLYSPLQRNLLGPILPPMGLGLRPPQSPLHGLPTISPYHSSSQRQSPHAAIGLNLALGLPNLPHPPPSVHSSASLNLSHHLPPTSLSLGHPAGLSHHSQASLAAMAAHSSSPVTSLSLGHAGLGLSHPGLNLSHPHMASHAAASVPHPIPPHSQHQSLNLATTSSSNTSLNLSQSATSMSKSSIAADSHHSGSHSTVAHSTSAPVVTSHSSSTSSLSTNIPSGAQLSSSMYYHHPAVAHHQSSSSSHHSQLPPSQLAVTSSSSLQHSSSVPISLAHSNHHSSMMKASNRTPTPSGPQNSSNTLNQNGGRTSASPITRNDKEPTATLDLTGGGSSHQSSIVATGGSTTTRTTPSLTHEINGSTATISDHSDSSKDGPITISSTNSKDEIKLNEDQSQQQQPQALTTKMNLTTNNGGSTTQSNSNNNGGGGGNGSNSNDDHSTMNQIEDGSQGRNTTTPINQQITSGNPNNQNNSPKNLSPHDMGKLNSNNNNNDVEIMRGLGQERNISSSPTTTATANHKSGNHNNNNSSNNSSKNKINLNNLESENSSGASNNLNLNLNSNNSSVSLTRSDDLRSSPNSNSTMNDAISR